MAILPLKPAFSNADASSFALKSPVTVKLALPFSALGRNELHNLLFGWFFYGDSFRLAPEPSTRPVHRNA